MKSSGRPRGQEVVIVPCVAEKGKDDARNVSVMQHLWNTLEVLKKQTDVAVWAAHGLLDVEEFQFADIDWGEA